MADEITGTGAGAPEPTEHAGIAPETGHGGVFQPEPSHDDGGATEKTPPAASVEPTIGTEAEAPSGGFRHVKPLHSCHQRVVRLAARYGYVLVEESATSITLSTE